MTVPNAGRNSLIIARHLQLEFGVGDWVLLLTKNLIMHGGWKLAQQIDWDFCTVQERVGAVTYRLSLLE